MLFEFCKDVVCNNYKILFISLFSPSQLLFQFQFVCFLFLCVSQHQQQVVQAVERAKQVTMAELNAIIGVGVLHTHTRRHTQLNTKCIDYFFYSNVGK